MKTLAAVLVEQGAELEMMELEIPKPQPGHVLVRIDYSGVCFTQVMEWQGYKGPDPYIPHCLGHEAVGEVLDTGVAVSTVAKGQRVFLSWIKGPGCNVPGTVYTCGDTKVNAGGVTSFMQHALVSENRITPLNSELPSKVAPLLGCAVPTGFGAVYNTGELKAGESVAVLGCGGVGLCALAAASAAGCSDLIAVDTNQKKLEMAKQLGATTLINVSEHSYEEFRALFPAQGVDLAIEASGKTSVMLQAMQLVRAQGGRTVVIGNAKAGEAITLDPKLLNMGKQLRGTWGGDNEPARDFPRYVRLLEQGKIDLSPLLSEEYSLEQATKAMRDLEEGKVIRPIIKIH